MRAEVRGKRRRRGITVAEVSSPRASRQVEENNNRLTREMEFKLTIRDMSGDHEPRSATALLRRVLTLPGAGTAERRIRTTDMVSFVRGRGEEW